MTNPDMTRLINLAQLKDDEKPPEDSPMSPRGRAAAGVAAHKAATDAQIANTYHQIAGLELQRQLLEHQLGDVKDGIEARHRAIAQFIEEHRNYRKAMGFPPIDENDPFTRGTTGGTTNPPRDTTPPPNESPIPPKWNPPSRNTPH